MPSKVIAFIGFLFLNVEQMAVEIEQPFGDDPNDLPQESYIMAVEEMLLEMVPGFELQPDDDDDGGGIGGGAPVYPRFTPVRPAPQQPNGYAAPTPQADIGSFIAKYRMTPEMSGELLQLLQGGGAPPQQGGDWMHVSPGWGARGNTRNTRKP